MNKEEMQAKIRQLERENSSLSSEKDKLAELKKKAEQEGYYDDEEKVIAGLFLL